MMDGSLLADGKTPVRLRLQRRGHPRGRRGGARQGRQRRGRARDARRDRGRPRLRRGAPDRPRPGGRLRRADRRRRARRRDRHEPRRLQVHEEARRRGARDAPDRGDPRQAARNAHGHARLLERPARARRPDQRRRRQARVDLRRAGRGDPAGDRATACARSTSTPTGASRSPRRCASRSTRTPPSSTRARSSSPPAQAMKEVVAQRMTQLRLGRPRRRLRGALARARWPRATPGAPSVPEHRHRPAQHQHDPDARRSTPSQAAQSGHPGRAARARAGRLPALHADHEAQPRPIRPGPTATASCSRPATPRCCSTRASTSPATTLSLDEIKQFRQLGSHTPGHPEHGETPGRRDDDRPARPGLRQRVGMAMAEKFLREKFGTRGLRPPHLRDLLRRRPDGGRRLRGRLDRRPPAARPAASSSTTTTRSRSTGRPSLTLRPARTSRSASGPTAGTR